MIERCPNFIILHLQKLPKDTHIVVLDLPGHGDTTIPSENDKIDIKSIVHYVHEV